MQYRVIFRIAAQREAIAAAEYIAQRSGAVRAAAWLTGLEESVRSLATMPRRHPVAREAAALGVDVRQAIFESHRLLFVVRAREVHVLHVRHAARGDLDELIT